MTAPTRTRKTGKNRVIIFDTTLRDGEQSPGCLDEPGGEAAHRQGARGDGRRRHRSRLPDRLERRLRGGARDRARVVKKSTVAGLAARRPQGHRPRLGGACRAPQRPRIHTFISTSPLHMKYKLQMEPEAVHQAVGRQPSPTRAICATTSSGAPRTAARTEHDFLCRCVESAIKAGAPHHQHPRHGRLRDAGRIRRADRAC